MKGAHQSTTNGEGLAVPAARLARAVAPPLAGVATLITAQAASDYLSRLPDAKAA